jgi:hypothetical protein
MQQKHARLFSDEMRSVLQPMQDFSRVAANVGKSLATIEKLASQNPQFYQSFRAVLSADNVDFRCR